MRHDVDYLSHEVLDLLLLPLLGQDGDEAESILLRQVLKLGVHLANVTQEVLQVGFFKSLRSIFAHVDDGFESQLVDVVGRVLVDIGLLKHLIGQIDKLFGVQLLANILIFCHVMKEREYFLAACIGGGLILLLELPLHEEVEHLGLVLHVDLILRVL